MGRFFYAQSRHSCVVVPLFFYSDSNITNNNELTDVCGGFMEGREIERLKIRCIMSVCAMAAGALGWLPGEFVYYVGDWFVLWNR